MNPRIIRVVGFAVVPDKLYIVKHLLDFAVLVVFEFFGGSGQIHGVLDYVEVVSEPHPFPIHRLPEIHGVVGFVETVDDYFDFLGLFLADFGSRSQFQRRAHLYYKSSSNGRIFKLIQSEHRSFIHL